ncbi:MAG: tetratricopeptide repeat protein [Gammaproteobacteria bacterium]|nr:tetratricopeptide repeat protein [Gammaproteobacteria bacterium]
MNEAAFPPFIALFGFPVGSTFSGLPGLASAAFQQILSASAVAALLILLTLGLQTALRKRVPARWRFILWMPVLVRLLVPALPESPVSLLNAPRWFAPPEPIQPASVIRPAPVPALAGEPVADFDFSTAAFPEPEPAPPNPNWPALAARLWLAVALLLLSRLALASAWMRWRLRGQLATAPGLEADWRRLAARLGVRPPPLRVTPQVESPALFGVLRPRLLLPANLSTRLAGEQLRHVFLHELAHVKRRDLWLNLLIEIAQALHWFNPFVWLAGRQMRLEREIACDQIALAASGPDSARAYGETILFLLETVGRRPSLAPLVGIAEEKSSARARLREISELGRRRHRAWLVLPAALVLILGGLTDAQTPSASPAPDSALDSALTTRNQEDNDWKSRLAETRIDQLHLENKSLAEALELLREKLPPDLRDIEFFWEEPVNLSTPDRTPESGPFDQERMRSLEKAVIEARVQESYLDKLLQELEAIERKDPRDLRAALPTAHPDAVLDRLLTEKGGIEQEIAAKVGDYGPQHPEMLRLKTVLQTLDRQIDSRVEGVLSGLRLKAAQARSVADELTDQLEPLRKETVETASRKNNSAIYSVNATGYVSTRLDRTNTPAAKIRITSLQIEDQSVVRALNVIASASGTAVRIADRGIEFYRNKEKSEKQNKATGLIDDAGIFVALGRWDEANAKLSEAALLDPEQVSDFVMAQRERLLNRANKSNPTLSSANPQTRATNAASPLLGGPEPSKAPPEAVLLVNAARLLIETGNLDQAEETLNAVLKADPDNRAALYYRTMVNPYSTNRLYVSTKLQTVQQKLQDIVFDRWFIPAEIPLTDVVKSLDAEVRMRDPDHRGLNFLITSLPNHGPIPSASNPSPSAADFLVKIDPPLRNMRLIDILDAIVRVARPPQGQPQDMILKYSIEDYGVVFTPSRSDQLYTRTFKVDPNTFIQGLDRIYLNPNGIGTGTTASGRGINGIGTSSTAGGGGIIGATITNSPSPLAGAVRTYFAAAGINFPTNSTPGQPQKAIFYNDRTGVLFVRAPLADLDVVETALQALNTQPPQLTFEVRLLQIPAQLPAGANGLPKLSGVMTEAQFAQIRKFGFKELILPRVTTLAGRGARVVKDDNRSLTVDLLATLQKDDKLEIKAGAFGGALESVRDKEPLAKTERTIGDGETLLFGPIRLPGDPDDPPYTICVTATLIDPAGNRLHPPKE